MTMNAMLYRAKTVRVCAQGNAQKDCRPIFSAPRAPHMKMVPMTLRYIDEMMDAAADLCPNDRHDYLNAHGIDLGRVVRYFEIVKGFEQAFQSGVAPPGDARPYT